MPNANPLLINELRYDSVDVKSVHFDFGAGFSETWEDVELAYLACPCCDFVAMWDMDMEEGDECPHCEDENVTIERPECSPMMCYYYPLPHYEGDDRNPEADQMLLYQSSANVVLVKILGGENNEDTYALALSGGGMDFSWDICHAFILLGYAPPLFACDVPEFAGQDNSQEPFWSILKACLQSADSAKRSIAWTQSKLAKLVDNAVACPTCGHPDRHNRMGGCERISEYKSGEVTSCPCTEYPEGQPDDAQAVREQAHG